jgi:hypothetical protein
MKSSLPYFRRPAEHAAASAGDFPAAREVLVEICLMLAIHLAIALAVTLSLRAIGIVAFE